MIPGQIPRAQFRNTLMYRVNADLQVGVEYNPLAPDVGPLLNWRVVREGDDRPAVIVGTSSDRIGTPSGRAYYLTVSKSLGEGVGLYVGASYSGFEKKLLIPAGVSLQFDEQWSSLLVYDGVNFHPMVTHTWDRYGLTLLLANLKYPGISISLGF